MPRRKPEVVQNLQRLEGETEEQDEKDSDDDDDDGGGGGGEDDGDVDDDDDDEEKEEQIDMQINTRHVATEYLNTTIPQDKALSRAFPFPGKRRRDAR